MSADGLVEGVRVEQLWQLSHLGRDHDPPLLPRLRPPPHAPASAPRVLGIQQQGRAALAEPHLLGGEDQAVRSQTLARPRQHV